MPIRWQKSPNPSPSQPLAGEPREQRIERVGDAGDVEPVGERLVEPGAREIAADIERVEARHPADNADIAAIRAGRSRSGSR